MPTFDPELRTEVNPVKASDKKAKVLDTALDEGRFAFISGMTKEGCRFRNPARRNAWERGWSESERKKAEQDSIKGMSNEEKLQKLKRLSAVKAILDA